MFPRRVSIALPQRLSVLILIGLLIRLPFMPQIGFMQDFLFFTSWASYLADHSIVTIYDDPSKLSVHFINYPPLYLYILTLLARVYRFFSAGPLETRAFLVLIKTTTVFFELLAALVLYRWVTRTQGDRWGRIAFALYFLNPAVFYVSVYYGQVDAIFAAFLLFSLLSLLVGRPFWSGFFLACSLLMKLQAIPFVPLFFLFPLIRREWGSGLRMGGGFSAAFLLVLLPFLVAGRGDEMYLQCVKGSIAWGKYITVGAFNLWYLHADPMTLDQRIWGWLFGPDGMLSANAFTSRLTYRNLGVGLFGSAFLWTLVCFWKNREDESAWFAASHVALAFYLFPTEVHERYLFPFLLLYAPLALQQPVRRMILYGFSGTYLVNVMVICPLFGHVRPVTEIDSGIGAWAAVTNVVLYSLFLVFESLWLWKGRVELQTLRKTVSAAAVFALFLFLLRVVEQQPDPHVTYLSQRQPSLVQQDWPPVGMDPALPPGYQQVGKDLSVGELVTDHMERNTLRIRDTFYKHGLGAHARSRIEYDIPADFDYFDCYVGVDAEVLPAFDQMPERASVNFSVWMNDELRYSGPLMIPTLAAVRVTVPLPKNGMVTKLRLEVGEGNAQAANPFLSDHADWALARVVRSR